MNNVVLLLCGLPASGKSSFAEQILKEGQRFKDKNLVHIEYDAIEVSLPCVMDWRERWKKTRTLCLQKLKEELNEEKMLK
eukprot:snap_masked-scaffold_3-processed-gene-16.55-mRNA-1 protein AED:1.00 eAED:1.00 QI:0/-1/0/0/-1/1/1/0/79